MRDIERDNRIHQMKNEEVNDLLQRLKDRSLSERIDILSRLSLGTPYHSSPLGEGPRAECEAQPRLNLRQVDCMTFVEQTLALGLSRRWSEVLPTLDRIRYRDGAVGIDTRNHFVILDWLPNNRDLVEDLTQRIDHQAVRLRKMISRADLFRRRGWPEHGQRGPQLVETSYIPVGRIRRIMDRIPAVSIAFIVKDRTNLIVTHLGFVVLDDEDNRMLRHASKIQKMVVEEELSHYISGDDEILGIKIGKPKEPELSYGGTRSLQPGSR